MCLYRDTPEAHGIPSDAILSMLRILDAYHLHTHSILLSRADTVLAEAYYRPMHAGFQHRMYSTSKSFVAVAVGLAVTEGLFSLEDSIVSFFPEWRSEVNDEYTDRCKVRDMLSMRSNVDGNVAWWGRFTDRITAYYSQRSNKLPGTLFKYDSIGSFLLGCIIERLTGRDFLSYMKDRVLRAIGFSEESFVLREPGGFAVGDSGVVCTARDLWLFARFIMKGGTWDGVSYINPAFMREATSALVPNSFSGDYALFNSSGYGYLIWRTHESGFALVGLGDQLAFCDEATDVCFVMTADNQAERNVRQLIFHEFLYHLLPRVAKAPLPACESAYTALCEYLDTRRLVCVRGMAHTATEASVLGHEYRKSKGDTDVEGFCLTEDVLYLTYRGVTYPFSFGRGENVAARITLGTRAVATHMGLDEVGAYDGFTSAAWTDERTFSLMAQVTDTYFGSLCVHVGFDGEEASVHIVGSGQYVFGGIGGSFIARKVNKS